MTRRDELTNSPICQFLFIGPNKCQQLNIREEDNRKQMQIGRDFINWRTASIFGCIKLFTDATITMTTNHLIQMTPSGGSFFASDEVETYGRYCKPA